MLPGPTEGDFFCGFITKCIVKKGEELVWDYGSSYHKVKFEDHHNTTNGKRFWLLPTKILTSINISGYH